MLKNAMFLNSSPGPSAPRGPSDHAAICAKWWRCLKSCRPAMPLLFLGCFSFFLSTTGHDVYLGRLGSAAMHGKAVQPQRKSAHGAGGAKSPDLRTARVAVNRSSRGLAEWKSWSGSEILTPANDMYTPASVAGIGFVLITTSGNKF